MPRDDVHSMRDRSLNRITAEVAAAHGLTMTTFCDGWVIRLEKHGVKRHIFGHNFELNSAATRNIASDKPATAAILEADGVPCVPHTLFTHPRKMTHIDAGGNWQRILDCAAAYGNNVVCKTIEGSGGHAVIHAVGVREVEFAAHQLFQSEQSICISPYLDIDREYRVVLLDGEPLLCYGKSRPFVTGDGERTVLELIAEAMQRSSDPTAFATLVAELDPSAATDLAVVPDAGEHFTLGWKHNLRLAGSVTIEQDGAVTDLAVRAANAINLRFGAVDIARTPDGLLVLEINSGFMTTHLIRIAEGGEDLVRGIYERAILRMFEQ
jgi:glutathione synthase/RimK-type ligase-like ATP-grasp enzyme